MRLIPVLSFAVLLAACGQDPQQNPDATLAVNTPAPDSAAVTTIQWLDSTHQNLGKINEGQVVEVVWRFKNSGNKPLIIKNASASCGCTVAEKPEAPIAPGGEGSIKAKFDSKGREGTQRKEVYINANTAGLEGQDLSFSVEVSKKTSTQ